MCNVYTAKSNYGSTEKALLCRLNGYNGTGNINCIIQMINSLICPSQGEVQSIT